MFTIFVLFDPISGIALAIIEQVTDKFSSRGLPVNRLRKTALCPELLAQRHFLLGGQVRRDQFHVHALELSHHAILHGVGAEQKERRRAFGHLLAHFLDEVCR